MHEDIDGDSPDWIERVQEPEAIGRTESEDIFAFTDDDKGLQKKKQNNITRKQQRIITLCWVFVCFVGKTNTNSLLFWEK